MVILGTPDVNGGGGAADLLGFVGDAGGSGFAALEGSRLTTGPGTTTGVTLRGEVVGVGDVPVNVATPVPFSSGVNEGDGGPAERPKISLMMDTMSSSSRSAAVGLRAPFASGLPRAHSRAVASRREVSSPSCRPSLSESGSARTQSAM